MKISEQDMKEARKIAESLKGLNNIEKAMVSTYATALRDRKMYAEFA